MLPKDQDAALVAARQKLNPQVEQQVPVEAQTAEPESTEEPVKQVAEEAPKEQPKVEVKEQPEEVAKPDEKPWYADEEEVVTEPKSEIDFSQLGSALELGEIKTKEEFITKASELKSKLKQLEEDPLSGIPDEFKEVIKVTKTGADWKDYLANQLIDYSKFNGDQLIQLFEDEYYKDAAKNPEFFTDGKLDPDKVNAALDAMPESLRKGYGQQLAFVKSQEQKLRQDQLRAQAEAKLNQAEKSLASATKNLNEILPFESYGIKFEPQQSSQLFQGITNSKLTKKHLGVDYETLVRSGANMNAITRSIALAEFGEKMLKYKSQNAKTAGKKEILTKTQNVQLDTPGSRISPEQPEQKVKTTTEKLKEHFSSNKVGL